VFGGKLARGQQFPAAIAGCARQRGGQQEGAAKHGRRKPKLWAFLRLAERVSATEQFRPSLVMAEHAGAMLKQCWGQKGGVSVKGAGFAEKKPA